MEGQEYSSAGNDPSSHAYVPNSDHHIQPNSDDEEEFDDLLAPGDGTFVIQVPKDQIYRVPPPENAIIAERHRLAVPQRKTCFSLNCLLLCGLILFLFTIFVTGISIAVADKDNPGFRVRHIRVHTKGKGDKKEHEFIFTLRSKNPNDRAAITFEKGGRSSLSFNEKPFAKGKFPMLEQDSDSLENMKVKVVSGSGKKLPKEIQKSIDGKSRKPVKLALKFKVPLRFNVGAFPVKNKKVAIVCNLKVNKLTKNAHILSQDCDYSTKVE